MSGTGIDIRADFCCRAIPHVCGSQTPRVSLLLRFNTTGYCRNVVRSQAPWNFDWKGYIDDRFQEVHGGTLLPVLVSQKCYSNEKNLQSMQRLRHRQTSLGDDRKHSQPSPSQNLLGWIPRWSGQVGFRRLRRLHRLRNLGEASPSSH